MRRCDKRGFACGFDKKESTADFTCYSHGPPVRKRPGPAAERQKPWAEKGLTILPSPEVRWAQILRGLHGKLPDRYELERRLETADPWTRALANALDVSFKQEGDVPHDVELDVSRNR